MPTVYYVNSKMTKPEPVECEIVGWPNTDEMGRTMYENTHYRKEADAWKWLVRDAAAHLELLAGRISRARSELLDAENDAADAVVRASEIRAAKNLFDANTKRGGKK